MNVEVRHLRALAAIGDEGTISAAAAALRLSQPALSRTLDQLERRVGTRLVERTTRRLALTDAGKLLHERAHTILKQLDDALAEAAADSGPRPLRVGFAWAALGEHTIPLLRDWRSRFPESPVRVHRRDDPELALQRGEVDVAVIRTTPRGDADSVALFAEPRLAAVPDGHPLASRPAVRLTDLAGEPVALCSSASTSGESWPHGFDVGGVDEWLTTIASGEAVGVTTQGTQTNHPHPGVRYLPLTDADPVTVHLVWPRPPTHPATGAFTEFLTAESSALPRRPASPTR